MLCLVVVMIRGVNHPHWLPGSSLFRPISAFSISHRICILVPYCCGYGTLYVSILYMAWWRHQMETFSALLALCAVNSPHKDQWHVELWCFFYLHLNKRLSKQSRRWWFETPSRPLWCHCNWMILGGSIGCLPISFRVTSLALGQSCDCPSASDVTLKDIGKIELFES